MTKDQNVKAIKDLLDQHFTIQQKAIILNNVSELVQTGPFFDEDNSAAAFDELFAVLLRYYDDPFFDAEHLAAYKDFSVQLKEFEEAVEEANSFI